MDIILNELAPLPEKLEEVPPACARYIELAEQKNKANIPHEKGLILDKLIEYLSTRFAEEIKFDPKESFYKGLCQQYGNRIGRTVTSSKRKKHGVIGCLMSLQKCFEEIIESKKQKTTKGIYRQLKVTSDLKVSTTCSWYYIPESSPAYCWDHDQLIEVILSGDCYAISIELDKKKEMTEFEYNQKPNLHEALGARYSTRAF
ncbi:MAG TPA: hypothetical protein VLB02_02405 [Candidatus Paceibacterota bacterium]|nr:hypothetical protein [Candidatus Paceibacterota bacterium]